MILRQCFVFACHLQVLVQHVCHRHIAPHVVRVIGQPWLVVLMTVRRLPWPTQFGDFPSGGT